MPTRRSVLLGLTGTILGLDECWAEDEDFVGLLQNALADRDPVTLGRLVPPVDSPLWGQAQSQLRSAAAKKVPYGIASYFVTSLPPQFQTAWPEPNPAHPTLANPLIVLFFLATKTKPSGDKTAWCAAFMNWCLNNATPSFEGTRDASSQSFVHWGDEVWNKSEDWPPRNARRGDIAVFKLKSDPTHGHVTFFQGPTLNQPRHVDVLGGNQFNSVGLHTFNVQSLNIGSGLELITIRSAKGLRNA